MSTVTIPNLKSQNIDKFYSNINFKLFSSKESKRISYFEKIDFENINFQLFSSKESNSIPYFEKIDFENIIIKNLYTNNNNSIIAKNSSKSPWYNENEYNPILLSISDQKYCDFIYNMIKRDDFEIGYLNETIRFVKREVINRKDKLLKALQKILITYSSDDSIWISVLNILSNLSYAESEPYGIFIAGSAISRKNIEIKEMAVVMFEEWCNVEALDFLKEMETGIIWLDKYIKQVIHDIEKEISNNGLSA